LGELQGKTQLVGNSHRRAGYYVLLAPDVPAVLLELGFLSNAQDETLSTNIWRSDDGVFLKLSLYIALMAR